MTSRFSVLSQFHPLMAEWFEGHVGQPTDLQEQAWPRIAAGEHVLITGPTGSGKTLAAFFWALNQLIKGNWPTGLTRVLYVSPMRALNYDIQRNLLGPLEALEGLFEREGEVFPQIHALTRSGDTPQSDRRRMLRHPPEILITTPESLNLLLSSRIGRSSLTHLSTVILDEIHAVFGTKRGVYLVTAVDRLVRLSGEFQRIALSATIRPVGAVAEFVGGVRLERNRDEPAYTRRPVSVVTSEVKKRYELRVSFPREERDRDGRKSVWMSLVQDLKKIITKNRSTLIFVNNRRLCEMLTHLINQDQPEPVAYSHHGSLSLEIRSEVERRLKAGELRAIVATHSLELGIDIGALDEVVLIQSPFSISSAIQRVGRAGHQVNEMSRGVLFPTHRKDLLEAAVLAPVIISQDIEPAKGVQGALDVLAQILVSMVGLETWDIDELFTNVRATHPYRNLSREQYDLVLNMLAGRYEDSRIRELKPLLSIDRLDNTVAAKKGALQTIYLSGGVIPDRGYFNLRHEQTNARIGTLDEEFVWEARVGDTFTFGTQSWRIRKITHNDVLVLPASPKASGAPFWKGEEYGRDFHFSERIGQFLEEADGRLEDPHFRRALELQHCMEPEAAERLIDFLREQKEVTGAPLPHRRHLLVEFVASGPGGTPQAVIHTMWGGRVNRPLAMALDAAWQTKFNHRLELYVSDDSVVLQLADGMAAGELLSLVTSANVESLLRVRLEGSGFFGARFRECAGRALLLPRNKFNERLPLWLSRLRSQKLLEAVLNYEDFPILLETWRTCMLDEFDLESLRKVLAELESGVISWSAVQTHSPSPFAQGDWWRQVNQYMYMDDTPGMERVSKLRGSLLREVVFNAGLRPSVSREIVDQFERKRKRLSPGYAPRTPRELLDWVVERVAIPQSEWKELLESASRDLGVPLKFGDELQGKLLQIFPTQALGPLVVARERVDRTLDSFYGGMKGVRVCSLEGDAVEGTGEPSAGVEEGSASLGQWLQFYGPVTLDFIRGKLGIEEDRLQSAIEDLIDSQKVIQGRLLTSDQNDQICDSDNFEVLLRMVRKESIPAFEPLGIEWLPLFLADHQGITRPGDNLNGLYDRLEQLLCYPAEAGAWESEIFPARLDPYDPSWLDTIMQEGDLLWVGSEGHRVTFCFESEVDLLQEDTETPEQMDDEYEGDEERPGPSGLLARLFRDRYGRFDFSTLLRISAKEGRTLARELWDEAWRGRLTNDTFLALRRVILSGFNLTGRASQQVRRSRHRLRLRDSLQERKEAAFAVGSWSLVPNPDPPGDPLEAEERRKDRVRILLDRYGILFREILQREWPGLRWSNLFRALRLMELSGEVMAGTFFHGIPGPQFISSRAFRALQQKLPEESIYWINAMDPVSLCGLQLESLRGTMPARLATNHLVFQGTRVVMVSKRNGRNLTFHVPADDPHFSEYLCVLRHLLTRRVQPLKRIAVETINGERAVESPYLTSLRSSFEASIDPHELTLYRTMN